MNKCGGLCGSLAILLRKMMTHICRYNYVYPTPLTLPACFPCSVACSTGPGRWSRVTERHRTLPFQEFQSLSARPPAATSASFFVQFAIQANMLYTHIFTYLHTNMTDSSPTYSMAPSVCYYVYQFVLNKLLFD